MNSFSGIITDGFRHNRMRTAVIIIGVVLSSAIIMLVIALGSSFQNYFIQAATEANGAWHLKAEPLTLSKMASVKADKIVENVDAMENVGYAYSGSSDTGKPYIFIAGLAPRDYNAEAVHIVSGRAAKKPGEIVIPENMGTEGGPRFSVGETITLSVGDRYAVGRFRSNSGEKIEKDDQLTQSIEFVGTSEAIRSVRKIKYRVVGICERAAFEEYNSPGYTAFTYPSGNTDSVYTVFVKTKDPSDIYGLANNISSHATIYKYNDNLLSALGVSEGRTNHRYIDLLISALVAFAVTGTILLLYNAFSILFADKREMIETLVKVGCTRRQIYTGIAMEANFIAVPAAAAGGLAGIAGCAIICAVISPKLTDSMLEGSKYVTFGFSVTVTEVVLALVIAYAAVMISALLAARAGIKEFRVMASDDAGSKPRSGKRPVRTPFYVRKFLGYEGELAYMYYRKDRKRYRGAVISLFLVFLLFITASAVIGDLDKEMKLADRIETFDLEFQENVNYEAYYALKRAADITASNIYEMYSVKTTLDRSWFTAKEIRRLRKSDAEVGDKTVKVYSMLAAMPDDEYARYAARCGFKKHMPAFIASDRFTPVNDNGVILDIDLDNYRNIETLTVSGDNGKKFSIDARFACSDPMGGGILSSGIRIYTSRSNVNALLGHSYINAAGRSGSRMMLAFFKSASPKRTYDSMMEICGAEGIPSAGITNEWKDLASMKGIISIMKLFSFGFILLVSLIAAANVFNTISMNMLRRRRESLTLLALGMTEKSMKKMINAECIFYGKVALELGLSTAIAVLVALNLILSGSIAAILPIPWKAAALCVLSLVAVVAMTIAYSTHKMKKTAMIDVHRIHFR